MPRSISLLFFVWLLKGVDGDTAFTASSTGTLCEISDFHIAAVIELQAAVGSAGLLHVLPLPAPTASERAELEAEASFCADKIQEAVLKKILAHFPTQIWGPSSSGNETALKETAVAERDPLVLLVRRAGDALYFVQRVRNLLFWKPQACVLIMELSEYAGRDTERRLLLESLGKSEISNAAVLPLAAVEGDGGGVSTLCRRLQQRPWDLRHAPLRACAFHNPPKTSVDTSTGHLVGFDAQMAYALAQDLNAELQASEPADGRKLGTRFENGSFSGCALEAAARRAGLVVNSRYVRLDWRDALRFTYPHAGNALCVTAPKAGRVPAYRNLALPFSAALWAAVGGALAAAALAARALRPAPPPPPLEVLRALLWGAAERPARGFPERAFWCALALCSLVLTNAYQGSLTSYLAVPQYLPDINTLEALWASGLRVRLLPGTEVLFEGQPPGDVMSRLRTRVDVDGGYGDVVARVALPPPTAAVSSEVTSRWMAATRSLWRGRRPLLHVVDECPLRPGFVGYQVPRALPFLLRLEKTISLLLSGGFPSHWVQSLYHEGLIRGDLQVKDDSILEELTSFSPEHLQSAFFILVGGFFISIMSFLSEIYIIKQKVYLSDSDTF